MSFQDDDRATLDLVLGQTYHLLGVDGDVHAQRLVQAATLRVQRNGGIYHPMPGDNWDEPSYEAVLRVDPNVAPEFTPEVTGRIWAKLEPVLRGRDRTDVFGVVVEANVPPLPEVGEDWRATQAGALAPPTNQARRERANGGHPERDGLALASRAEAVLYDTLVELQRVRPRHQTFAVAPLPGVKLRDAGVRTPDFLVFGNGRVVVIEVDGAHHYGTTRRADDADRDRHWSRCGVPTVRIGAHHTEEPGVAGGGVGAAALAIVIARATGAPHPAGVRPHGRPIDGSELAASVPSGSSRHACWSSSASSYVCSTEASV